MPIQFDGNIGFNKKIGGVNIGVNFPFGNKSHNTSTVGKKEEGTKNNSIGEMMAVASNANLFARPNVYRVDFTPPNKNVSFNKNWTNNKLRSIGYNCDTINIPGHNLSTRPNRTHGLKKEYVYDKLFDTVNATFYVSEQMDEYHFFTDWQKMMFNESNGDIQWYNNYTGTVVIHQLSRIKKKDGGEDLSTTTSFRLVECYPKTVSPLRLGYGLNNQVQKIDVSFTFRKMVIGNESHDNVNEPIKGTNPLDKKFSLFRNLNVRGGFKLFGRQQLFNINNR